jgi:hypothetical protein
MEWMVWWLVGFAASAVSAQAPDGSAPTAAPAIVEATLATEPLASPTRRPTRRSTQTASATQTPSDTATAAATETATAAPATLTPTRRPLPSATLTAFAPTATAVAIPIALPGDGKNALPLLIGAGLALLGVIVGAFFAGLGAHTARRRARRTLATTMLLELRRIDAVLRKVVGLENPTSFPSLDHPIMEAALRDLTMFRTDTAARIAQFHGALRGIQNEIGDYRDNPLRWAGRLGELNQLIKTRAAAACRAVPELLRALEREGGAPPPQLHETPSRAPATPSGLPPPPFGEGDADDWTM